MDKCLNVSLSTVLLYFTDNPYIELTLFTSPESEKGK